MYRGRLWIEQDKLRQLIGVLCVNAATLVWASNMVLGRMLKDSIGPVSISAARFLIAAAIFYVILRQQPVEERRIGNDFWKLTAMAVTGIVLFSPVLYLGLRYTTAVNSTIINGLAPLLTGLLSVWLIQEPMSGRQAGGAMLALAGVLLLISGGSLSFWQSASFNIGDLIVLGAVAIWALYSVISSKVMRSRTSLATTAISTFIGLPVLWVFALWELQHFPVTIDLKLVLVTLYLGIVPAAGGFYAWNAGVRRLGTGGAMVFYNTLPLYGAALGYLFLGEPIGLHHAAGGLLIAAGGIWAASKGRVVKRENG